ncbi:MAG TPA: PilZ domain-containing protein [Candidatus Acidoferrum sp.]
MNQVKGNWFEFPASGIGTLASQAQSKEGNAARTIGPRRERKMGGMTERRTSRRYDLSLPILVRVPAEKTVDSQKGRTRDISPRGLYFVMDRDPQTGSRIDLVLTLPTEVTSGTEVLVHALGKVLRVEPRIEDGNTRMGVAAIIERYDIVREEAAPA